MDQIASEAPRIRAHRRVFLKEKHQILIKLGAFYNNLLKIHPIYVIWARLVSFVSDENPAVATKMYTEFRQKR